MSKQSAAFVAKVVFLWALVGSSAEAAGTVNLVPDDRSTELTFEGVGFFAFEVRLDPGGVIPRDPANNRLYLVVRNAGGDIIGATSIAVTTSDVEGGGFGN